MARLTKPITMNDLARLANVSAGTVSRALQRPELVKKETRDTIVALAKEYGFTINLAASGLRSGKTGAIGVIIPMGRHRAQQMSDPFLMTLIGHLADMLSDQGYSLLLSRVLPDDDHWMDRMISARLFDGAIIIGQSNQDHVLDRIAQDYTPMVVWGQVDHDQSYCTVGTDNVAGGQLAARHLIDQGASNISFLGDISEPEIAARFAGCQNAVNDDDRHIDLSSEKIAFEPETAFIQISNWLKQSPQFDAIVAASDLIAMSALRALREAKLRVPDHVRVIGYDDLPVATQTMPPLSSIRQDIESGAQAMVRLLLDRMNGQYGQSQQMPPQLVIRQST